MRSKSYWTIGFIILFLNFLLFLPSLIFSKQPISWWNIFPEGSHWGSLEIIFSVFLRRDHVDPWRISLEMLIITGLCCFPGLAARIRRHSKIFALFYCFLIVYECYSQAVSYYAGKLELFSEDLLYLINIWHYAKVMAFESQLFYGLVLIVIPLALFQVSHYMFRHLAAFERYKPQPLLQLALISAFAYSLICLAWFGVENRRSVVQASSLKFFSNLMRSREDLANKRIASQLMPPEFDAKINYPLKPNIFLIIMESYGEILLRHEKLQQNFRQVLSQTTEQLANQGFYMKSALSQSPVFGGRSWLSQASIYGRQMISQQWQFETLLQKGFATKNLASLMQRLGYHTVGLYPGNRRQNNVIGSNNVYHKDRVFSFEDLNYHGITQNWGHVPDQYSLYYVWENYLKDLQKPVFFTFLTISSHAPWYPRPQYVDKWQSLNTSNIEAASNGPKLFESIFSRLKMKWFQKHGHDRDLQSYFATIQYEWAVLKNFILENAREQDLFMIIGDHQPYLAAHDGSSDATLFHVISKDRKNVSAFSLPAMSSQLLPQAEVLLKHADIFTIIESGLEKLNKEQLTYSATKANKSL